MRKLKHPDAAAALDELVAGVKPKRKRPVPSARKILDRALVDAETMRKTNDWSEARGKHLVALYAWLHGEIYKVEAAELLDGKTMLAASSAADRMLRDDFGGDGKRAVEFIAWAWYRERSFEKAGRTSTRRLGWRLLFASKCLLVDYRVELVRGQTR